MSEPTCETCRFGDQSQSGGRYVVCRRYPPVPIIDAAADIGVEAHQPFYGFDEWCGEHQLSVTES